MPYTKFLRPRIDTFLKIDKVEIRHFLRDLFGIKGTLKNDGQLEKNQL